jgi:hypothetical protein
MNSSIGPFLSAVAVGVVAAMVIGNLIAVMTRRTLLPKSEQSPARDAVQIDDPALQIAAWGMPPGASQRTVSLSEPAVARARTAPAGRSGALGRPVGAGYGAARRARAEMLSGR